MSKAHNHIALWLGSHLYVYQSIWSGRRLRTKINEELPPKNERKQHGRPEWTRTIDLFRVKEAL